MIGTVVSVPVVAQHVTNSTIGTVANVHGAGKQEITFGMVAGVPVAVQHVTNSTIGTVANVHGAGKQEITFGMVASVPVAERNAKRDITGNQLRVNVRKNVRAVAKHKKLITIGKKYTITLIWEAIIAITMSVSNAKDVEKQNPLINDKKGNMNKTTFIANKVVNPFVRHI